VVRLRDGSAFEGWLEHVGSKVKIIGRPRVVSLVGGERVVTYRAWCCRDVNWREVRWLVWMEPVE
jgi:hypothetical protein